MKVTCYDIVYDAKREPSLVKEKTIVSEFHEIAQPKDMAKFISQELGTSNFLEERAHIIALNASGKINGVFEVSRGLIDKAFIGVREIFIRLILSNSNAFILTHNHPSGSIKPSIQDLDITKRLKDAGELMGISLLDHIIISQNDYYSFKSEGTI